MDLVPSTAPFSWYKRDPASIWIDGDTALLQVRTACTACTAAALVQVQHAARLLAPALLPLRWANA